MEVWRRIGYETRSGAANMALDAAILAAVDAGEAPPTLRLYGFAPPALSLGYGQPDDEVDFEACRRLGIEVVRRPTGGRAVLHDRDLTYALVVPSSDPRFPPSVSGSYQVVAEALRDALSALGVRGVELAPRRATGGEPPAGAAGKAAPGRAPHAPPGSVRAPLPPATFDVGARAAEDLAPDSVVAPLPPAASSRRPGESARGGRGVRAACFGAAARAELLVGGRKVAGSAQRRGRHAFLQHGTILIDPDPDRLAACLRGADAARLAASMVGLARLPGVGPVGPERVAAAVTEALAGRLGIRFADAPPSPAEERQAAAGLDTPRRLVYPPDPRRPAGR